MESFSSRAKTVATDWAAATGVPTTVFGFLDRALLPGLENHFCAHCPLGADGRCQPQVAHRFGCYEAERWDGQYIYYCPASLVFVATLTYECDMPSYALVSGPLVMGPADDLLSDLDPGIRGRIDAIATRTPAEVGALARTQQTLCTTLFSDEPRPKRPEHPHPAQWDSGREMLPDESHGYPFGVEQQLVKMVRKGDRAGAAEMINHLLAALYLSSDGEFRRLRHGATELVTLFSRAAIEGGADAALIFGEKRALDRRLAGFTTLDQVSGFLVSVFNRFVGYVFDFSKFQHANTLRKVVEYVRAHHGERITLTDAAREVWLSPSYLSSVFSSEMGMTFTAYVQSVRVDRSRELLLSTHRPIAEIATATGFSDQSYFTKVFTRVVGVSPTQFRLQEAGVHG